ncbi:unnamed protein product [Tenebrio molitor]|nr:unnamed protein product [Tenebrio molitor]
MCHTLIPLIIVILKSNLQCKGYVSQTKRSFFCLVLSGVISNGEKCFFQ